MNRTICLFGCYWNCLVVVVVPGKVVGSEYVIASDADGVILAETLVLLSAKSVLPVKVVVVEAATLALLSVDTVLPLNIVVVEAATVLLLFAESVLPVKIVVVEAATV